MSTNCVRCVKNRRVPPSLLCGECADKEYKEEVERMMLTYPSLREFIETYEHPAMAGKGVFRGQTCKMVLDVYRQATRMREETGEVPPKPMEVLQALCLSLEEDFLLALRFLYYVKTKPVVPDAMYDAAEKDFLARPEVEDSPLMNPGSDNAADYPDHVKALAFYLSMMGWQRGQEAGKEPSGSPAKPRKAKAGGKPAGYVEAAYVGDLFE